MKKLTTLLILMVMLFTPINIKAEDNPKPVETTSIAVYTPNKKVIDINKGQPTTNDNTNFKLLSTVTLSSAILFMILLILKKKKVNEYENV